MITKRKLWLLLMVVMVAAVCLTGCANLHVDYTPKDDGGALVTVKGRGEATVKNSDGSEVSTSTLKRSSMFSDLLQLLSLKALGDAD